MQQMVVGVVGANAPVGWPPSGAHGPASKVRPEIRAACAPLSLVHAWGTGNGVGVFWHVELGFASSVPPVQAAPKGAPHVHGVQPRDSVPDS